MHKEFKETLLKFYRNATQKREFADIMLRSLERCLTYSEIEDDRQRQSDNNNEDAKSFKSGTSGRSTDSFTKVRRLFVTGSFVTAVLFGYLMHLLKARRIEKLNMVFKNVSDLLKKYERHIKAEDRKRFLAKLIKLNEQLLFLSSKVDNRCKIDWQFYEVFTSFEIECQLFAQIVSSFGDTLESLDSLKNNQYCNFLASLNIKCYLYDHLKKTSAEMGGGDIKLYIGKNSSGFYLSSQMEHERTCLLGRKEQRLSPKPESSERPSIKDQKKLPSNKFKQQFLSEMQKLKLEYESNTAKIASLFNFKDSPNEQERLPEDEKHI